MDNITIRYSGRASLNDARPVPGLCVYRWRPWIQIKHRRQPRPALIGTSRCREQFNARPIAGITSLDLVVLAYEDGYVPHGCTVTVKTTRSDLVVSAQVFSQVASGWTFLWHAGIKWLIHQWKSSSTWLLDACRTIAEVPSYLLLSDEKVNMERWQGPWKG